MHMKYQRFPVFVISGIFVASILISGQAWAQSSVTTQHGNFSTEFENYSLKSNEQTLIKISGYGEITSGKDREKVGIIITLPDSSQISNQIFSTNEGYFETFLSLQHGDLEGEYKVFASFGTHILGEIYFNVDKESHNLFGNNNDDLPETIEEEPKIFSPSRTTTVTVESDLQSYEKGSTIEISGKITNFYASNPNNISSLTLQIINPKNSIIHIEQLTPDVGGTFSILIKADGQMWNTEGDYTAKATYENLNASTTFDLFLSKSDIIIPLRLRF